MPQTTLADQEGPSAGSMSTFELMSSKDLAYQMTMFDWELFSCVHEVLRMHTHTKNNFRPDCNLCHFVCTVLQGASSYTLK